MKNITFKTFKASEIEFVNKHENGTRIEFENKYSYNVKYSPNNTCIGEFTVEVNDKANKDKFHIKAVVLGIFTYNSESPKEVIHVETYKELFPYVRTMISSLTVNAGIPPVIIPNFDIESQNIYRFEKTC
ncbi:MAG: protein-export chaperone SecB [Clostridia bacterium]|nr:protein-export chaperone SecB [Clostridia bacterium]MBR3819834.1 protein-export chaperone SecB [Clostridia bacterium]